MLNPTTENRATDIAHKEASVLAAAEALYAARLPFRSLAPHDFEPIRETAEAALHEAEMRLDETVKALNWARA